MLVTATFASPICEATSPKKMLRGDDFDRFANAGAESAATESAAKNVGLMDIGSVPLRMAPPVASVGPLCYNGASNKSGAASARDTVAQR